MVLCGPARNCLLTKSISRLCGTQASTVIIPRRIERGPTDILKALAATVGSDYTSAHYKFHDDPFLTPTSNYAKRAFALSKESGRKAARFIRDKHSEYFLHREADPFIEAWNSFISAAFAPNISLPEDLSSITEADLLVRIEAGDVDDCAKIYEAMLLGNKEMSIEVQQKLLEVLCFFNAQDAQDPEFLEERWFSAQNQPKQSRKKIWRDGGLADEIFKSMPEPRSAQAYAAIIRGMAKHLQVEKAWHLFEETKSLRLLLDTETYNALIRVVNFLKDSNDLRWQLVTELLSEMRQASLRPNVGTLNAVMEALTSMGSWRQRKEIALATLAEFTKVLHIRPSLGTYALLLNIFYNDRGNSSTIVYDVLDLLEKEGIDMDTAVDPSDVAFFSVAMDLASNKLGDLDLAHRIHSLLLTGRNSEFVGDSFKESIYYRNYFLLLNQNVPFDEFMSDYYEKLVPFAYTPEPSVMQQLLKSIDLQKAVGYLPKLWSDMIIFDQVNRQLLVEDVLSILATQGIDADDEELRKQLLTIAADLWNRVETLEPDRSVQAVSWTGTMLGQLLTFFSAMDDTVLGAAVVHRMVVGKNAIAGLPAPESLTKFFQKLVDEPVGKSSLAGPARNSTAVELVCYAQNCAFPEARDMVKCLGEKFTLDQIARDKVNAVFGEIVLEAPVERVFTEEELYQLRKLRFSDSSKKVASQ